MLIPSNAQDKVVDAKLISALISVESGGRDDAVGDNGKALGCLQIWEVVIQDVNRVYKTKFTHKDMFVRRNAITVCYLYLKFWGAQYEKTTGEKPDYEVLARMWNGGGPKGWKNPKTVGYWNRVKVLV